MKNIDFIYDFIKQKKEVQFSDIKLNFLDINESTVVRSLNKLVELWKINKKKIWKNTSYKHAWKEFILDFLNTHFFERPRVEYNPDFLKNYIPNKSTFLWDWLQKIIKIYDKGVSLSTYDYKENIRWIENLLIDLSFASSRLEWNTYSYLDTEVLVKYNEEAEWKSKFETQMIINHKEVIKFLLDKNKDIIFSKDMFFKIHAMLSKWLITEDYIWTIRSKKVKIWWSQYLPIETKDELMSQFEIFLNKLNEINNPFEQSLFILVFIPYFQLFMDINKRVSRLWANLPLIKNWLSPLSLLQVKERDYINAILAIYELNDVSLMSELFVENYLLNIDRYIDYN